VDVRSLNSTGSLKSGFLSHIRVCGAVDLLFLSLVVLNFRFPLREAR
jgi:hypothetical protein